MSQSLSSKVPVPDRSGAAPGPALGELLRSLTGLRDNPLLFIQESISRYGDFVHFRIIIPLDTHLNAKKDNRKQNIDIYK